MPATGRVGTFRPAAANVRLTGVEGRIDFDVASHRHDLEFDAEFIGETPRQFVFRALGRAVRSAIIGQGARARDHAQLTERLDLIDQARKGEQLLSRTTADDAILILAQRIQFSYVFVKLRTVIWVH